MLVLLILLNCSQFIHLLICLLHGTTFKFYSVSGSHHLPIVISSTAFKKFETVEELKETTFKISFANWVPSNRWCH